MLCARREGPRCCRVLGLAPGPGFSVRPPPCPLPGLGARPKARSLTEVADWILAPVQMRSQPATSGAHLGRGISKHPSDLGWFLVGVTCLLAKACEVSGRKTDRRQCAAQKISKELAGRELASYL